MTQKPKQKRGQSSRLSSVRFALLWTLTLIAGAVIQIVSTFPMLETEIIGSTSILRLGVAAGAIVIGIAVGWLQQRILQQQLNRRVRGWLPATAIGYVVASFFTYLIANNPRFLGPVLSLPEEIAAGVFAASAAGIIALAQVVVLRQYMRRAWLWVVAALFSAAVFMVPRVEIVAILPDTPSVISILMTLLESALQGGVMGLVMARMIEMDLRSPDDSQQQAESTDDVGRVAQARQHLQDAARENNVLDALPPTANQRATH